MLAEESLKAGKLDEALKQLQDEVRKHPSVAKYRTFLFQLLSVLGQWDRALTQLEVATDLDATAISMLQTYQALLQCEALRADVFAGRKTPLVFGKPQEWVALLLQALKLGAEGRHAEARPLRERAFEAAPTTAGALNGEPFEWIADADPRLGPTLEAVVNGKYYWIPFQRLRSVEIDKPSDLRDLVWLPATLTYANGGQTVAFVPTRYAGSESSPDPQIRLARRTDWAAQDEDTHFGVGQRLLATDKGEHALLDVRTIHLQTQDEPAEGNG